MMPDGYILLIAKPLSMKIQELENLHMLNLLCKKAYLNYTHQHKIIVLQKITNGARWMK